MPVPKLATIYRSVRSSGRGGHCSIWYRYEIAVNGRTLTGKNGRTRSWGSRDAAERAAEREGYLVVRKARS